MDNLVTRTWSPKAGLVVVGWVGAGCLGTVAAVTDDPRGRLLIGLAALMLVVLALAGSRRPRLTADQDGLTVRGLTGTRHWTWGQVAVRLVHTRRLGRESALVEIDADEDLVLLGWLELGADPTDVVGTLLDLRAAHT